MRIQKRYIYAGILAGLLFILFYVIISIDVILSIAISIPVFFAGILIFKEKDVRVYDPNKEYEYCYQTSKLLNFSNYIDDKKIKNIIISISKTSEEILNTLEQNKDRVTQVYNFYDYYLDLAVKMVAKYMSVANKDKQYVVIVDDYLSNIDKLFKEQLESIKKNTTFDLEWKIKMFEKKFKITNIEGSEDNAKRG